MKRSTTNKKNTRFIRHEQWIEVMQKEGKTVTVFYPPNNEFERLRLLLDPPPDMIYRRFNFLHGIPTEYAWLDATPEARLSGGLFLPRNVNEDWPKLMNLEYIAGKGHAISSRNPQPRPAILGPCPCDQCTAERADPSGISRYDL